MSSQTAGRGAGKSVSITPIALGALDHAPPGLIFAQPRLLEVADPALRFADMLDRLGVLDEALRRRIDRHRPDAGVGIEGVGMPAKRFADVVLEQAVDQDHVAAGEFLQAPHLLPDELAMVHDELDVEALHAAAGLALAAVGLLDVAQPLAEGEIGLLDRILQERPVDFVGERIDESGVAFEFGQTERRTQRLEQRVHDVGDDVLGVVEFDAGHEIRVAGNVGDHETGQFRLRKHGDFLPFRQRHDAPDCARTGGVGLWNASTEYANRLATVPVEVGPSRSSARRSDWRAGTGAGRSGSGL